MRGADKNEPKLSKTKTIKYKKSTTTDKSNGHTEENLSIEDGAYYTQNWAGANNTFSWPTMALLLGANRIY